jgi:hypothetical protein
MRADGEYANPDLAGLDACYNQVQLFVLHQTRPTMRVDDLLLLCERVQPVKEFSPV